MLRPTLAIVLVLAGVLLCTPLFSYAAPSGSYSTSFPLTETPISEGGSWLNGGVDGLDWSDVWTKPGLAYTTQFGGNNYNDSIAVLKGTFASDQQAQATVYNSASGDPSPEISLRLRSTITPHSSTGYEMGFSAYGSYCGITRWNGAYGNFTYLSNGSDCSIGTGDVILATAIGSSLTLYRNGVVISQVNDTALTSGNPGMNLFSQNGPNPTFGFSSFSAQNVGPAPSATPTSTPGAATSTPTSTPLPTGTSTPTRTPTRTSTPTIAPCRARVSINGKADTYVNQPNNFCGLP